MIYSPGGSGLEEHRVDDCAGMPRFAEKLGALDDEGPFLLARFTLPGQATEALDRRIAKRDGSQGRPPLLLAVHRTGAIGSG